MTLYDGCGTDHFFPPLLQVTKAGRLDFAALAVTEAFGSCRARHQLQRQGNGQNSLVPWRLVIGEKSAWYPLFTHA